MSGILKLLHKVSLQFQVDVASSKKDEGIKLLIVCHFFGTTKCYQVTKNITHRISLLLFIFDESNLSNSIIKKVHSLCFFVQV